MEPASYEFAVGGEAIARLSEVGAFHGTNLPSVGSSGSMSALP